MKFSAYGHKNILATHKTTLEFTKDKELTLNGDCIIGINSDFELDLIKDFIKNTKKIKIKIKVDDLVEEVNCEINPDFDDGHEIVVRKTDFLSERTLGINADKAAVDLNRKVAAKMKEEGKKIEVELCESN